MSNTNPIGTFRVRVDEVQYNHEREYLHWLLEIIEGPNQGQMVQKFNSFKSEGARRFLVEDAVRCGLMVTGHGEVLARREELQGRILEVESGTNAQGYPVVYIKRRIEEPAPDEALTPPRTIDTSEDEAMQYIRMIEDYLSRLKQLVA